MPADLHAEVCWPTTLFHCQWEDHDREAPGILEFLYSLQSQRPGTIAGGIATRAKSAQGLYESDYQLFTQPHPGLQKLIAFIGNTLARAISHVDSGREKAVQAGDLDLAIPESWFHISNRGGHHDAHNHHNCSWCGIYYVRVGSSGPDATGGAPNGGSRFYSPLAKGGSYRDIGNRYLIEEIDAPIHDGMLLLFPSYLQHSGLPYEGNDDRVVIAFNAQAMRRFKPTV
jgi:uncharacterized protein (TIGR02466 family)